VSLIILWIRGALATKGIPNPPRRMVFIALIIPSHRILSLCGTIINEREWRDEETGSHAKPYVNR
jgi:hypothetical protein